MSDKPKPPCVECGKPAYCTYRRVNSRKRDAFCAECEGQLIYQGSGKTVAEAGVPPFVGPPKAGAQGGGE